ncbi:MAG: hypothetical protein ACOVQX_02590 [Legionella sp.]
MGNGASHVQFTLHDQIKSMIDHKEFNQLIFLYLSVKPAKKKIYQKIIVSYYVDNPKSISARDNQNKNFVYYIAKYRCTDLLFAISSLSALEGRIYWERYVNCLLNNKEFIEVLKVYNICRNDPISQYIIAYYKQNSQALNRVDDLHRTFIDYVEQDEYSELLYELSISLSVLQNSWDKYLYVLLVQYEFKTIIAICSSDNHRIKASVKDMLFAYYKSNPHFIVLKDRQQYTLIDHAFSHRCSWLFSEFFASIPELGDIWSGYLRYLLDKKDFNELASSYRTSNSQTRQSTRQYLVAYYKKEPQLIQAMDANQELLIDSFRRLGFDTLVFELSSFLPKLSDDWIATFKALIKGRKFREAIRVYSFLSVENEKLVRDDIVCAYQQGLELNTHLDTKGLCLLAYAQIFNCVLLLPELFKLISRQTVLTAPSDEPMASCQSVRLS